MNEALQKAIDCLEIRDVYLYSSHASLESEFEPKYDPTVDGLIVQYKHHVIRSSVLKLEGHSESIDLFRVYVELGARWVSSSKSDTVEAQDVKAKIEGTMVAEYLMETDPGKEALNEFALKNASYHIWPYWREYLAAHTQRMNLPKLILPTVQFSNNHRTDS